MARRVYLSRVYASPKDQRSGTTGVVVRGIDYTLDGVPGADPLRPRMRGPTRRLQMPTISEY